MKKQFLLIGLLLLVASYTFGQQKAFDKFVESLTILELPYSIDYRDNIFSVNPWVYDNENEMHIRSKYEDINKVYSKFIEETHIELGWTISYRSIGKFLSEEFIGIVFLEDFYYDGEIQKLHVKVCTFTKEGTKIDELELGGYYIDIYENYFSLDKPFISAKHFNYVQPLEDDSFMYAKETSSQYELKANGKFKHKESKIRYVKYDNDPNKGIEVDYSK